MKLISLSEASRILDLDSSSFLKKALAENWTIWGENRGEVSVYQKTAYVPKYKGLPIYPPSENNPYYDSTSKPKKMVNPEYLAISMGDLKTILQCGQVYQETFSNVFPFSYIEEDSHDFRSNVFSLDIRYTPHFYRLEATYVTYPRATEDSLLEKSKPLKLTTDRLFVDSIKVGLDTLEKSTITFQTINHENCSEKLQQLNEIAHEVLSDVSKSDPQLSLPSQKTVSLLIEEKLGVSSRMAGVMAKIILPNKEKMTPYTVNAGFGDAFVEGSHRSKELNILIVVSKVCWANVDKEDREGDTFPRSDVVQEVLAKFLSTQERAKFGASIIRPEDICDSTRGYSEDEVQNYIEKVKSELAAK